MLSHGLTTGALFLLVGMLYDRRHTYELSNFRGIWKVAPVFGGLFVAATFASIGLPGFSGFVGEFLSLLGAFLSSRWYVVVATTGVIFAAVYLLWAVQRAFTGVPDEANRDNTPDIGFRELVTVVPLLAPVTVPRLLPEAEEQREFEQRNDRDHSRNRIRACCRGSASMGAPVKRHAALPEQNRPRRRSRRWWRPPRTSDSKDNAANRLKNWPNLGRPIDWGHDAFAAEHRRNLPDAPEVAQLVGVPTVVGPAHQRTGG